MDYFSSYGYFEYEKARMAREIEREIETELDSYNRTPFGMSP